MFLYNNYHFFVFKIYKFKHLLKGKYKDEFFYKRFYQPQNYPLLSATLVAFGIKTNLKNRTEDLVVKLRKPLKINNALHEYCIIKQFSYDPMICSDEKSVLTITLKDAEYDYWEKLKNNSPDLYKKEKERKHRHLLKKQKTYILKFQGTEK